MPAAAVKSGGALAWRRARARERARLLLFAVWLLRRSLTRARTADLCQAELHVLHISCALHGPLGLQGLQAEAADRPRLRVLLLCAALHTTPAVMAGVSCD